MKFPQPSWVAAGALLFIYPSGIALAEVGEVQTVASDVYFHEGDLAGRGHCNNGWIVFEDYVLVIDANFPSGAKEVLPKIRAITDKPIRFAFDTHHHGDHLYGNHVWVDHGAVPVAHVGVIDELKKHETGGPGTRPSRWEDAARTRPDVAASKLKPPTLLYRTDMIFDDGNHRVELLHFGVAHTHGDGFAWLPTEKILFTGDACVNGPYNFVGDGDTGEWVKTLEAARQLGAKTVCPGHGPVGGGELLENQQAYFVALRKQVSLLHGKTPAEIKAAVDQIKAALLQNPKIARYVGDSIAQHVEKVHVEMGGKPFQSNAAATDSHEQHAHAHGNDLNAAKRN
jgi:glyoxylase-like metal-dependent hydrolase (beta-lactamase superfamily II)